MKNKFHLKVLSITLSLFLALSSNCVYATALSDSASDPSTNASDTSTDTSGTSTDISDTSQDASHASDESSSDVPEELQDAEYRLKLPIASNSLPNWPAGPAVSAQSAIIMDADSGTVLYSKNIHEKLYPASTTKILTALVAIENSSMDETVNFTADCLSGVDLSSSNMGMDPGQSLPMEQCLYGILVHSANEVCNAVAEHIAGSIPAYVDMMNQKAAALGCQDSHFMNPNGLHDDNHYTSAYDLATIARAFFQNDTLTKISNTKYYLIEPSQNQPDTIECYTHNAITKGQYQLDGYLGGKTGYTSNAHSTLVTCAKRGDLKLICVVMKEDSPSQFTDTITLFDYGFQNFHKLTVSEHEKKYTINDSDFFNGSSSLFDYSDSIIYIDPLSSIVLPNTLTFDQLSSSLSFVEDTNDSNHIADITYQYEDMVLGKANVMLSDSSQEENTNYFLTENDSSDLNSDSSEISNQNKPVDDSKTDSFISSLFKNSDSVIYINVYTIIIGIIILIILLLLIIHYISYRKNYHFGNNNGSRFKKPSPSPILRKPRRHRKKSKDYVLYKNKRHLSDSSKKVRRNKKRQS